MLFLFVDGLGLGPASPATNPLATAHLPHLEALVGGRPLWPERGRPRPPLLALDACLGQPGLPQSGTGQVALLTGENAAARAGGHFGPYPPPALRPLLAERSLWARLSAAGRSVAYANAFPDRYLERVARGTARMGAIARAALLAGVRLRGPAELGAGRAVSAFLDNAGWREHLGYRQLPDITEAEAGARLAALARDHDFTLFEHYAADVAGHRGDMVAARAVLEAYDRFLGGVLAHWDDADLLILASDHGNVEDLSTTRHTRNPALAAWRGRDGGPLASLTDVAPALLSVLAVRESGPGAGPA